MKRVSIFYFLLVSIFFFLLVQAESQVPDQKTLSKRIDEYLSSYHNAQDFSGVVLIAHRDQVLFERAYGFADHTAKTPNKTTTAFRIASLSKTFTSAAISILIERGKVGLEDRLSKFFPDYPNGNIILVKHLLLHSSGVGRLDSTDLMQKCLTQNELVQRIAKAPPLFPPDTDGSYSNEGYMLLAAIIEKASGTDYEAFLKKNIFEPLGMKHTGAMCTQWPVQEHATGTIAGKGSTPAPLPFEEAGRNGPGSLYSTAGDLLIWLKAEGDDKLFKFSQLKYPYGWGKRNYSGKDLVEQSGQLEGYNSLISLYPKDKYYFVFLSNIQSGMFNRLPKDFEALVFGGTASAPPVAKEIVADPNELKEFGGDYVTPSIPVPLQIVVKDGRLWSHFGESQFLRPLIMTGKDEFFLRAEYTTLSFQRDSNSVTGVSYKFGDSEPLVLTRKLPD